MKRFFALFAALTLFCTGISAQTAACRTETGIAYRDAAGDGYVDSLCRLDICWPADRKGFPTVVWFHGGGLTGGRREIPKALCGKGFAVVGVDYRLAPRVKVADCVADAAAAAAWVVKNIASYGGDPRLIFIAGHSAGGYLTLMIGLDKRWMAPYGIDPDTAFAALIPYSGHCQTVLTDLFNEVFCDCVEPAKLIKSKEFINAIIPLLPFKQGKSLRNIRRAIVKYVLGEG